MQANLARMKSDLVQHYRWLRQYGCNDSHSGNASFRWHDEIWITPTGCCADTLQTDDLVICNVDGTIGDGASLDTSLHIEVYRHNTKAQAVFHSHGPHAIALTLNGDDFVPIDFEGQYYFPTVPVVNIAYDRYIELSPSSVAEKLAEHKVTIVRGHGVYAYGETINLAYKWSCSVELSAKIALLNNNNASR
jgi:L-fuculose-phosphate aldolase